MKKNDRIQISTIEPLRIPPVEIETVSICGYEFTVFRSDAVPEGELWLVGKDWDSITKVKRE